MVVDDFLEVVDELISALVEKFLTGVGVDGRAGLRAGLRA